MAFETKPLSRCLKRQPPGGPVDKSRNFILKKYIPTAVIVLLLLVVAWFHPGALFPAIWWLLNIIHKH